MRLIKKARLYLLMAMAGASALLAGATYIEGMLQDYFITTATENIKEEVKEEAEDRLKEKLFSIIKESI